MKRILITILGLIFLIATIIPYGLSERGSDDREFTQPLAHIEWERKEINDTLYFSLSALSSLDPDHLITSYEWIYTQNGTWVGEYFNPFMIFEIKEDGIYNISLTIRTEEGYSDTVGMNINYEPSDDNKIIMGMSVTCHVEVLESLRIDKKVDNEAKWFDFSILPIIIITISILIIVTESIVIFLIRKRIKRKER